MKHENMIRQNGFNFLQDKTVHKENVDVPGVFLKPRDWQVEAFNQLKDKPSMILNAPMGSGKSFLMCLLSAYKMKKSVYLKCIIAVPQKIIASGFLKTQMEIPGGEQLNWIVGKNLCDESSSKGTVEALVRWLKQSLSQFEERIVLCTHATLVATHKKLRERNSLNLWNNALVWIDEAHHVKNSTLEDLEDSFVSNELGKLVAFFLSENDLNLQLGLTTASFFRGDRCTLLTKEMEKQFKRYSLPYDRYLDSMKHLKSFNFDFLLCGYDYIKGIEALLREKKGRDIVYIPHTTSRYSLGDKRMEVKTIIEKYQTVFGGDLADGENGLTLLTSSESDFKILDLVDDTPSRRSQRQTYVHRELKKNPTNLNALIAMGMFKEGADWVCADRCIIVGPRASLVDVIQMIGRLLRDFPGKEHVEVVQLLPLSFDQQNDDFRDNLNNFLKAIFASMILEDIFRPVTIKIPQSKEAHTDQSEKPKKSSSLSELVPDEATQLALLDDVAGCLARITFDPNDKERELITIQELYQKEVPLILSNYGLEENQKEIADQIWVKFQRRSLKMQGIDVKDIDCEFLEKIHPLEGLVRYTNGPFGIDSFKKFRDVLQTSWEKGFELLREYFLKSQNSAVPENLTVDGVNLFNWVTVQRKAFKNGSMQPERQHKLEALPSWYWDRTDTREEQGKLALLSFTSREKHSRVPTTHRENNFLLGLWVNQRKELYHEGHLSKEDVDFFESQPNWSWTGINDQTWDYGYSMLERFSTNEGHAQVPSGFKMEGFNLATWVKGQRHAFKKGRLSDERIGKLQSLPKWSWDVFQDKNKEGFDALDSFVEREEHALVPSDHIENGFKLGRWVAIKRLACQNPNSKHSLTEGVKNRLEAYPGWAWNGDQGRWEVGKSYLLKFCEREGNSRVKNAHLEDGFALGAWVGIWKQQYKKKILPQEKIDFFESLPEWSWDIRGDQWMTGFDILREYVKREGSASVTAKHVENGFQLGTWVRTQTYAYAQGRLSKEKIALLEVLPGWAWNQLDAIWNQGYDCLKKFISLHGTSKVPGRCVLEGYKLGVWVFGQKYKYRKKKLTEDRIALLESLPEWTWAEKENNWDSAYELLQIFCHREGHAKVKRDHRESGFNLGEWVQTQRRAYRTHKIDAERIDKLARLQGWIWNTK